MCSINGFICTGKQEKIKHIRLERFLNSARNRGRDSFGFYYKKLLTNFETLTKFVDKVDEKIFQDIYIDTGIEFLLMNNMRAEPTSNSEWIKDKTPNDTQPFSSEDSTIIHNGTISNDKDFNKTFNNMVIGEKNWSVSNWIYQETDIKIDSAIFLNFKTVKDLIEALKEKKIIGSFACVQYFKHSGDIVFFKNYMPLYLMLDYTNEILWFASEKETLMSLVEDKYIIDYNIIDFTPYSYLVLNVNMSWEDIKKGITNITSFNKPKNNKSLILCSGGLDSTVVTTIAAQKMEEITLLYFQYGGLSQEKEMKAVKDIAEFFHCKYVFIPLSIFKDILVSPLTSGDDNQISKGSQGIEYALEWIPARNLILTSLAIGYAEKFEYSKIYMGANLDEASAYPDNTIEFLNKLESVIPYATQNGTSIKLEKTLANYMKHEIVQIAISIGAPLHLMWSCYHNYEEHCGECSSCNLRKIAFQKIGVKDTFVKYRKEEII